MIKMLLVDDEPIICQGLRTTIPWEKYSIQIVDEAYDGKEALEKINQYGDIDIILSDVVMPVMDGIELAEALFEQSNMPKIIMISGYDEFDYAKKAMRVGVKDYLLKPVDINELLDTIKKLTTEIAIEKNEIKNLYELELKDAVHHELFGTPITFVEDELISRHEIYPIVCSFQDYYNKIRWKSEEEVAEIEKEWLSKMKAIITELNVNTITVLTDSNVLLLCLYGWDSQVELQQLKELLLEHDQDQLYHVVLSQKTCSIHQLPNHYKQMKLTLEQTFINRDHVVEVNDVIIEKKQELSYLNDLEDEIVEALFTSREKVMGNQINELFRCFQQSKVLLVDCVQVCNEIESKVVRNLEKLNWKDELLHLALKVRQSQSFSTVYNSYDLLQQLFEEEMTYLFTVISKGKSSDHNWMMERATRYIEEFYPNDLKAKEVADFVNISPNYFSGLFKQYTGTNFNEYLNGCRVEASKVLLEETSERVSRIAEQVGYSEYKYFVQVFKKMVKLTPTEYRKLKNSSY